MALSFLGFLQLNFGGGQVVAVVVGYRDATTSLPFLKRKVMQLNPLICCSVSVSFESLHLSAFFRIGFQCYLNC